MEDGFFDPAGQGDPVFWQHFMWVLGQPSTWIMLFLFVCLIFGIVKMTRQLWRQKTWIWGMGFFFIACFAIGYYIWLSVNALQFYREGRGSELVKLKIAKQILLGLSLSSLVWIIISGFSRRKTGDN